MKKARLLPALILALLFLLPAGCGKQATTVSPSTPTPAETVTASGTAGTLRVQVPDGWKYEVCPEGTLDDSDACFGVKIWPDSGSDSCVQLYWSDSFGVCGTGLKEETLTLAGDSVSAGYYDGDKNWTFLSFQGKNHGIVAWADPNADWFADKGYDYPTSWEDLLDPKYQDMIIMAHPATSGTAYTVLATLIQLKGEDAVWDYLKELDKNMSQYTKSGSAAPNAVALGEAAIALTFSHDGLQPTTEGYPIELSFPTDGTGYEVGAMALIKGGPADEQENAKAFIDFMCSAEGQNLYAENNSFRVPTNTQATVADGLVTLDSVAVIDYDAVWAAEHKDEFVAQFEANIASSENLE